MKKRVLLPILAMFCMAFAGCGNAESEKVLEVVEIPIEEKFESTESAVITESETSLAEPEQESVVFEDIEVEVNGEKGTILVGTTGAPFTELLTQAKIKLAQDGWDLQIKYYDNYGQLNADVLSGALDAHLFAHQTYIDSYNDVNKTELVCVAPVCYEVYGIYSELNQDLTKVSGSKIALPAEAEKKARTLLFMQDLEWITLAGDGGMTAIMEDIEVNDMNLQFTEYTQETLADVMKDCDYFIAGADTAIVNGLDVEDDAIRTETKNSASAGIYATLLVTTQDKAEDIKMKTLADALASDTMKEYVSDTYKGALELMR